MDTFNRLWNSSKTELFRLQMLNEYRVEGERGFVEKAAQGSMKEIFDEPSSIEWFSMLKDKQAKGVKNINLQVIDLPFTDYIRYEAAYMLKSEEFGRESFFVERKEVADLVSGFEDYWMFDRKSVLLMKYDKDGRYLSKDVEVGDPSKVKRYVELEDKLLKIALPLRTFLKKNGITIDY
jgi:hypothetical protein